MQSGPLVTPYIVEQQLSEDEGEKSDNDFSVNSEIEEKMDDLDGKSPE